MNFLVLDDLRGGRNATDPPFAVKSNQVVEALNVDWFDGMLCRKRGGSDAVTDSGGTAFSSGIMALIRHVPGADETLVEFWGVDGAATPIIKRMVGATTFANVTVADAIATRPQDVCAATLNGKLFLAYDSTQDRLHCYDPRLVAPTIRRVSLATPGVPTVADNGIAGTYAAIPRYYRVRWGQQNSGFGSRFSEAGAESLVFTPNGVNTGARVTQPTPPGEGETYWWVEVSLDLLVWYTKSGQIPIGTTTYDDGDAVTTYGTNGPPDPAGMWAVWPSVKYIISDGNRLLGAGAWESAGATSGGKNSRVWFSAVLGSTDRGDDERVPNSLSQKNWVDLNENDGGGITGLGLFEGDVYAFKYNQIWQLSPTGDVDVPYRPRRRSKMIGCVDHKSICEGEDESGMPCLYFMSHKGPYRIGLGGLQYLGRDCFDIWSVMNLAATSRVAHTVYHADKHQMWFFVTSATANSPDIRMVFDIQLGRMVPGEGVRFGWSRHTGPSAEAMCSVMMSATLAASMSRNLAPYIGRSSGTAIWECDTTTRTDVGTMYQAYIKTRPIVLAKNLGTNIGIGQSQLLAKAQNNTVITQTVDRDFGLETRLSFLHLTAEEGETRVLRKFDGSDMSGAGVIQLQLGDSAALGTTWTLDALIIPLIVQEPR